MSFVWLAEAGLGKFRTDRALSRFGAFAWTKWFADAWFWRAIKGPAREPWEAVL